MKVIQQGLCVLFLIFVSTTKLYGGSKYFTWLDPHFKTRARVDLASGQIFNESSLGNWQFSSKIQLESEVLLHLPPSLSNHYFFSSNLRKLIITVDGTGQVFELNFDAKLLHRIDKTFYSGYNFGADVFERNGQIYSVGGVGFWAYSKAITYFDKNTLEWQAIRPKNSGPETIFDGYQGYAKAADKFYTGGSEEGKFLENVSLSINPDIYAYDFKNNTWQLLGEINPELLKQPSRELAWNGNFFVQFSREKVYVIDPVKNAVFVYKSSKEQFQGGEYRLVSGDMIYSYWDLENGPLSKLSIKDIQSKAKYLGPFYIEKPHWIPYAVALLAFILLISLLWYIKRAKKVKELSFDEQEKVFLQALMALSGDSFLSTVEVNDLLGLSTKSLENQRRIRLNTIAQINQKIQVYFKIKKAIDRNPSPEDKRLSRYALTSEAMKALKGYI